MGTDRRARLRRDVERDAALGGGMSVVIALLIVIALTLLLGPGAIWNLIVWLSIGALLLFVGVGIVLLYQAYPEKIILFGIVFVIGVVIAIASMVAQERRERAGVKRQGDMSENRIPLPLFPQVIKNEQELVEQCYAVFYQKGKTDEKAAQVSQAIEQSMNRGGRIMLAGGCKKR